MHRPRRVESQQRKAPAPAVAGKAKKLEFPDQTHRTARPLWLSKLIKAAVEEARLCRGTREQATGPAAESSSTSSNVLP